MIPVTQTILHDDNKPEQRGNCMAACLASLLHVPIDTVPNYHGRDWRTVINAWLRQYGLALIQVSNDFDEVCAKDGIEGCWCIATGHTSRSSTIRHATVSYSGEVVFDPHPTRLGLTDIDGYVLLVALDPHKYARHFRQAIQATPTHEHTEKQGAYNGNETIQP